MNKELIALIFGIFTIILFLLFMVIWKWSDKE